MYSMKVSTICLPFTSANFLGILPNFKQCAQLDKCGHKFSDKQT